jgi:hypothetical protein
MHGHVAKGLDLLRSIAFLSQFVMRLGLRATTTKKRGECDRISRLRAPVAAAAADLST